jgi:hypothetical protein
MKYYHGTDNIMLMKQNKQCLDSVLFVPPSLVELTKYILSPATRDNQDQLAFEGT